MTSCRMKPGGILNSSPMTGSAGVIIVDEKGEMNAKSDTSIVTTYLRLLLQFRGLSGSFGPSHVTSRGR
jgi:hypothetical protein